MVNLEHSVGMLVVGIILLVLGALLPIGVAGKRALEIIGTILLVIGAVLVLVIWLGITF